MAIAGPIRLYLQMREGWAWLVFRNIKQIPVQILLHIPLINVVPEGIFPANGKVVSSNSKPIFMLRSTGLAQKHEEVETKDANTKNSTISTLPE